MLSFSANLLRNCCGQHRTRLAQPASGARRAVPHEDDAHLDGPVYEVIGAARDTQGVLLNGSDSEQIYIPMPKTGSKASQF
jgi:hypothetical protein